MFSWQIFQLATVRRNMALEAVPAANHVHCRLCGLGYSGQAGRLQGSVFACTPCASTDRAIRRIGIIHARACVEMSYMHNCSGPIDRTQTALASCMTAYMNQGLTSGGCNIKRQPRAQARCERRARHERAASAPRARRQYITLFFKL